VQLGGRWHKFETLEAATTFCSAVFKNRGVVLGIQKITKPRTPKTDGERFQDLLERLANSEETK
jgi:hypothetical protein